MYAQISKTINIQTPGTLTKLLTSEEKKTIKNLTVIGDINVLDIKCMRDEMEVLAVLDISEVYIKEYTGSDGTNYYLTTYSDNQMPPFSFSSPGPNNNDGKATLTTLKLPKSTTSIGFHCFFRCRGIIGNLTLPSSVTRIEQYAFSECSATGIVCLNTIPPNVNSGAFLGMTCSVYVPLASIDAYKIAQGWNETNILAIATDINELRIENNKIYIYPNPVKDVLYIDSENGSTFEILNLKGNVVYNGKIDNMSRVHMENLTEGVYLIKLIYGSTFVYKKIIKKQKI